MNNNNDSAIKEKYLNLTCNTVGSEDLIETQNLQNTNFQENVQTTIVTQNFYDETIKSNISLDSINSFEELIVQNPVRKVNEISLYRKGSQPTYQCKI